MCYELTQCHVTMNDCCDEVMIMKIIIEKVVKNDNDNDAK